MPADLDRFWSRIKSQEGPIFAAKAATGAPVPASLAAKIEVDFIFANHGKAPAIITALFCSFETHPGPPSAQRAAKHPLQGNPVIPAGGHTNAATVWMEDSFDAQQIADFRASRLRIWLWGRLIYQNAGGPPFPDRETEFLWVFDGPNDRFAPSDEGGPHRNHRT
jgi:hypothetical protein